MAILIEILDFTPSEITLEEAKQYCRVDNTEDDALVQSLLDAAQEAGLGYTHQIFGTAQIKVTVHGVISCLLVPYMPLTTIDSVMVDGEVMPPDQYENLGDRIVFNTTAYNTLEVIYTGGRSMPADVKAAILQRTKFQYDYPDDLVFEKPRFFEHILFSYRDPGTFQ